MTETAFVVLVARITLGVLFLVSGIGKLRHWRHFIGTVSDYQVAPEFVAKIVAGTLPWFELTAALLLIAGFALKLVGGLIALFLIATTAAVVVNLRRGREIECGCYSIVDTMTISWGTAMRNVLLLTLAGVVVGLGSNIVDSGQWLVSVTADLSVLLSPSSIALTALLVAFCLVTLYLAMWTTYIHMRRRALIDRS